MKRATKIESVIKNYGIMWRRDFIFWGYGGQRGCLEGRRSARKVDFRDQIGVYVLYDESRRPIYVGQAGQGNARLFSRLRNHGKDSLAHRWAYVSWFGLLRVNPGNGRLNRWDDAGKRVRGTLKSTLNEIEGVLIAATEPAFNKQGARFKGIHRYRQIKHELSEGVTGGELYDFIDEVRSELLKAVREVQKGRARA